MRRGDRQTDGEGVTSVVGAVSGWRDGRAMINDCLRSLTDRGLQGYYLDGAYPTFCHRPNLRTTPFSDCPSNLSRAAPDAPDVVVDRAGAGSWPHEAAKRTALVQRAAEHFDAEWVMVLDADERLEGPPGALSEWLHDRGDGIGWCRINLYSDRPGLRDGIWLPRLLRNAGEITFRPPRDWIPERNGKRIAFLPGEEPEEARALRDDVPLEVARIRHARQERPGWRLALSGRYAKLHCGPPCRRAPDGVHAYKQQGSGYICTVCNRFVDCGGSQQLEDMIPIEEGE